MKRIYLILFVSLFSFASNGQFTCSNGVNVYNGYNSIPVNSSGVNAPSGSYGCLSATPPNPSWLFLKACQPGSFNFEVKGYQGATQVDMDFVVFGNYPPTMYACSNLTSGFVSYCDGQNGVGNDTGQVSGMLTDYTAVIMISNPYGASLDSLSFYVSGTGVADPSCATCVTNNPVQEICFVTADSTNVYNKIIWEEAVSNDISHYEVLRENAIGGWDIIGTVDYDSLSYFIDTLDPGIQQPFTYNVRAVDTCFQSVDGQNPHTTMHLATSNGSNGVIHLLWTQYLGLPGYQTYYIWRGNSPTNLTLLDSVYYTTTSYTDWSPLTGQSYYQIEVRPGTTCTPTRTNTEETVFSNVSPNVLANGVEELVQWQNDFNFYPLPANGRLTIDGPLVPGDKIELLDQTGRLVYTDKFNGSPVDLSGIEQGNYFLRLTGQDNRVMTKMIPVIRN